MNIKSSIMSMFLNGDWSIIDENGNQIPVLIQANETQILFWAKDENKLIDLVNFDGIEFETEEDKLLVKGRATLLTNYWDQVWHFVAR